MKSRSTRARSARAEVGALLGVVDLVVELGETAPVLGPGPRVEHLAEIGDVAERCTCGVGAAADEVEHVDLEPGPAEEPGEVL